MRSDVAQFDLSAPPSLDAVLAQLAAEPGKHTPIAGGTELMVALNTGRLTQHSLRLDPSPEGAALHPRRRRTRSTSARARPLPTSATQHRDRRRSPTADSIGLVDRNHRQPEPRHARRQHLQRFARGRHAACAAGLRRDDHTHQQGWKAHAALHRISPRL